MNGERKCIVQSECEIIPRYSVECKDRDCLK